MGTRADQLKTLRALIEQGCRILADVLEEPDSVETRALSNLSLRERQVLELLGRGLKLKNIADELHISPNTVNNHRQRIRRKLKLENSWEVTRIAKQIRHSVTPKQKGNYD